MTEGQNYEVAMGTNKENKNEIGMRYMKGDFTIGGKFFSYFLFAN